METMSVQHCSLEPAGFQRLSQAGGIAGDSPVEVLMSCQGLCYQYHCSTAEQPAQHWTWKANPCPPSPDPAALQHAIVIQRAWRQYRRSKLKQQSEHDAVPWYAQGLTDEAHNLSMFTLVGRPHWYHVPRHRVWVRDIPLPWRRLTIRTPRGDCCMDALEVQQILAGGFWKPSTSRQPEPSAAEQGSLHAISNLMARHVKQLQREAEEVVQMLRHSRRRLAESVKCTGRRLMSGGISGPLRALLCCCGPSACAAQDDDSAAPGAGHVSHNRHARHRYGRAAQHSSDLPSSSIGCNDDDASDASSQADLQEAAEWELKRRLGSHSRLASTFAVLTWGRGDPLRTPLLGPVDSAADMRHGSS